MRTLAFFLATGLLFCGILIAMTLNGIWGELSPFVKGMAQLGAIPWIVVTIVMIVKAIEND